MLLAPISTLSKRRAGIEKLSVAYDHPIDKSQEDASHEERDKNQSNTPIRAIADFNAAMSASRLTFVFGLADILPMTVQTADRMAKKTDNVKR